LLELDALLAWGAPASFVGTLSAVELPPQAPDTAARHASHPVDVKEDRTLLTVLPMAMIVLALVPLAREDPRTARHSRFRIE
jgi:hypothetical protein